MVSYIVLRHCSHCLWEIISDPLLLLKLQSISKCCLCKWLRALFIVAMTYAIGNSIYYLFLLHLAVHIMPCSMLFNFKFFIMCNLSMILTDGVWHVCRIMVLILMILISLWSYSSVDVAASSAGTWNVQIVSLF